MPKRVSRRNRKDVIRFDRFIDSTPGLRIIDRSMEEGPPLFGPAERAALGLGDAPTADNPDPQMRETPRDGDGE